MPGRIRKIGANDRRAASPVNHRSANRADLIWRGCGMSRHKRPSECAGAFLFRHILAIHTLTRYKCPPGDSMAHDVFISYSTKNKSVADAVCAALEHAAI